MAQANQKTSTKPAPKTGAAPAGSSEPGASSNDAETESYTCLEPVKHNGKDHKIGDPIELTEAEAEPLLKQQAVEAA